MMKLSRKEWIRINDALRGREIDSSQFKHLNCIRIHPTESDEHFFKKVEKCRELFKLGHPFLTECWTKDHKQRFDILDLEMNEDIEIETGKSKNKIYKGDVVLDA